MHSSVTMFIQYRTVEIYIYDSCRMKRDWKTQTQNGGWKIKFWHLDKFYVHMIPWEKSTIIKI